MKKVVVEINEQGEIKIEFVGFVGSACSDERERIKKILLGWGIDLTPKEIRKKTPEQIASEVKRGEQLTRKAGYGRPGSL